MGDQLEDLGKKLLATLKEKGIAFVEKNADESIGLGEELVEAILSQALYKAQVSAIPPLPENTTFKAIADREEVCAYLSMQAQLIAAAEKENAERIKKLQDAAIGQAKDIAVSVAGICLQALVSGLLSKK